MSQGQLCQLCCAYTTELTIVLFSVNLKPKISMIKINDVTSRRIPPLFVEDLTLTSEIRFDVKVRVIFRSFSMNIFTLLNNF